MLLSQSLLLLLLLLAETGARRVVDTIEGGLGDEPEAGAVGFQGGFQFEVPPGGPFLLTTVTLPLHQLNTISGPTVADIGIVAFEGNVGVDTTGALISTLVTVTDIPIGTMLASPFIFTTVDFSSQSLMLNSGTVYAVAQFNIPAVLAPGFALTNVAAAADVPTVPTVLIGGNNEQNGADNSNTYSIDTSLVKYQFRVEADLICEAYEIDNVLNNCICANVETNTGAACETLDTSVMACANVGGSCADGELQALIDGGIQLCFDQSALDSDTLTLTSVTGVTDNEAVLGAYEVLQSVRDGEFVVSASLRCRTGEACDVAGGATIEWFVSGDAADCQATYQLENGGFVTGRRKRQVSSTGPPPSTFAAAASGPASATGDPHIVGGHGQRFDFYGRPNAIYSLFSASQFAVNMKLMAQGPKERFIDTVYVRFRNVTMRFDTGHYRPKRMQARMDALLRGVNGARVRVGNGRIEIELCDGHRVAIEQRFGVDPADTKYRKLYHLDVRIDVPGCHNDFGGILGETYRCDGAFEWNKEREESFHIRTGHDVCNGSKFSPSAPCHDVATVFAGRQAISGKAGHTGAE